MLGNGLPPIKYQVGNWDVENPELGLFDVMIGSDILYQPDHVHRVARFIDRHSSADVEVVIGDPDRANRSKFTGRMIDLGYFHRFERFDQALQDGNRTGGPGRGDPGAGRQPVPGTDFALSAQSPCFGITARGGFAPRFIRLYPSCPPAFPVYSRASFRCHSIGTATHSVILSIFR